MPALSIASGIGLPLGAWTAESKTLELERFIFDARFAEAYDIGQHVAASGVEVSAIADDLMDLWYSDLDLRWKQAPMALAGVTMKEALFVLETLALDHRMRVVFRGEHSVVDNGAIFHKLSGPAEVIDRLSPLPDHSDWETVLADAMTECPTGASETVHTEFMTGVSYLPIRDVPLHSWIIAPRTAVVTTTSS